MIREEEPRNEKSRPLHMMVDQNREERWYWIAHSDDIVLLKRPEKTSAHDRLSIILSSITCGGEVEEGRGNSEVPANSPPRDSGMAGGESGKR